MAYGIGSFVENDTGDAYAASVTLGSFTPAAGSALVAFIFYTTDNGESKSFSIADTAGGNDSWSSAGTPIWDTGQWEGAAMFVLANAANTSTTLQCTFDGNQSFCKVYFAAVEVTGIATSTPVVGYALQRQSAPGTLSDQISSGNTSTLTSQPAAIIGFSHNQARTSTSAAGTDYTSVGTGFDGGGATPGMRCEHKRVTATTAVAATFTNATDGSGADFFTGVVALAEGSTQSNAPRAAHLMKLMGAM